MLEPSGFALHRAIRTHGDIGSVLEGLRTIIKDIDGSVLAYREVEWNENKYVQWAMSHAWSQSRDALDNDLSLAILRIGLSQGPDGSDTVRWLCKQLGNDTVGKVIEFLEDCHPPDPKTPPFFSST